MNMAARLRSWIPITVDESGWAYDGPFSTYKELHAAILGFAAGIVGDPALRAAVVAYALGRGSRKSRAGGERADAHWRQVAEEPAYALGAMSVGELAKRHDLLALVLDVGMGVVA